MAFIGQRCAPFALVAHKGADADSHFDKSGDFKRNQRFAHGRPRDAEAHRQIAFRGQLLPGFHRADEDLVAARIREIQEDLIGDVEMTEENMRLGSLNGVVLDKDGTITTGELSVISVDPVDPDHGRNMRWFAGALERASEHPIARAVAVLADPAGHPFCLLSRV